VWMVSWECDVMGVWTCKCTCPRRCSLMTGGQTREARTTVYRAGACREVWHGDDTTADMRVGAADHMHVLHHGDQATAPRVGGCWGSFMRGSQTAGDPKLFARVLCRKWCGREGIGNGRKGTCAEGARPASHCRRRASFLFHIRAAHSSRESSFSRIARARGLGMSHAKSAPTRVLISKMQSELSARIL